MGNTIHVPHSPKKTPPVKASNYAIHVHVHVDIQAFIEALAWEQTAHVHVMYCLSFYRYPLE